MKKKILLVMIFTLLIQSYSYANKASIDENRLKEAKISDGMSVNKPEFDTDAYAKKYRKPTGFLFCPNATTFPDSLHVSNYAATQGKDDNALPHGGVWYNKSPSGTIGRKMNNIRPNSAIFIEKRLYQLWSGSAGPDRGSVLTYYTNRSTGGYQPGMPVDSSWTTYGKYPGWANHDGISAAFLFFDGHAELIRFGTEFKEDWTKK